VAPDPAVDLDWSLGSHAARLADWDAAVRTARSISGSGPKVSHAERTEMREQLTGQVERAESLVAECTGITVGGFRSRAWVMGRGDWTRQNLKGLQRAIEPLAKRIAERRPSSQTEKHTIARKALGVQVGALLGYVSRRVLGQVDMFLPPDDDGLIYFIGPNLVEVERAFSLSAADFRLWVAIHEVTHRVQFSGAPWLRAELMRMVDAYLNSVSLDSKELMEQLGRAIEELRPGGGAPGGSCACSRRSSGSCSIGRRR